MVAFSVMYNLPLYYQVVLDLPAAKAGFRLLPLSVGISMGSLAYGMLNAKKVRPVESSNDKGHYYWLLLSSYAFSLIGCGSIATFNSTTPAWEHFVCIFPAGIGYGGTLTLLLIALISSVSKKGIILQID
jgi:hypothetical protein